jgi:hypothetical protein
MKFFCKKSAALRIKKRWEFRKKQKNEIIMMGVAHRVMRPFIEL